MEKNNIIISETDNMELMKVDFDNIYKIHIKAVDERLILTKLQISFLSAPFLVIVTLISAKIIKHSVLYSFETIPFYIFAFIFICGLANIIPLIRFIEVTGTHMRTARAINNFRRFYTINLASKFEDSNWTPNLPTDPNFPPTFSILSWSSFNISFFAIINSSYITIGIFGFDGNSPISASGFFIIIILSIIQYSMYYFKGKIRPFLNPRPQNELNEVEI